MAQNTNSMKYPLKKYSTIGVCGLDCGMCPRYYTVGPSRCPGCSGPDFYSKHPSCSFITCCVKKRNLEVCGQCAEFPCSKFKSEEEYQKVTESSSYPSYKKVMANQKYIKKFGIEKFMKQQMERLELLQIMLKQFDDGRSRSFFCRAACLLEFRILQASIDTAIHKIKEEGIIPEDRKSKAKVLRALLTEAMGTIHSK